MIRNQKQFIKCVEKYEERLKMLNDCCDDMIDNVTEMFISKVSGDTEPFEEIYIDDDLKCYDLCSTVGSISLATSAGIVIDCSLVGTDDYGIVLSDGSCIVHYAGVHDGDKYKIIQYLLDFLEE